MKTVNPHLTLLILNGVSLQGMIQIYCELSSSDEPAIFDITKHQRHILYQLIHFACKNWDEHKKWYMERHT